ncbi:RNB domain-containing ribonuclease [Pelagicoccus sp. SDUM812003]|uniref:ribonuclease R family protein n=1 Tax=Pelagicoccus sp. SDUM812003 TaxID=3041267 RepID=UPI00280EEA68|nr:RNB domain-containing ribonuclease [Pelagicoccus sp. SDUM812003]MDQ8203664.1 RNB domain-containing ribonuclease [Pelagicoccus sp. SDUM812003]
MKKLRERIIALMQTPDYAALDKHGLSTELKLGKKERRKLDYEMRLLLAEGDIIRIKGDRFCLPKDVDLVTGVIKFRQTGSAILIPDPKPTSDEQQKAIEVRAEDTGVAMHGDRVVVRLDDRIPPKRTVWDRKKASQPRNRSDAPQGRVIRIQERARETIVGTLCKTRFFHYVAPDDPRIIHDIYVPDPEQAKVDPTPEVGSKVVVKLHEWEQRHVNPEGEIILNLGKTHEPQAELMAILHKYNLDPEFPPKVIEEAKAISPKVTKNQLRGRHDLREVFTFTIDPDDAKDFDDALSLEYPSKDTIRIGIHIADVASYVKPGTALDKEAHNRGNSTYLVGTVIPMLPHALSNGICSLVEDEDRLTKSVFVTFDRKKAVTQIDYANSVIRSDKRLTYKQAYCLLKNDDLQAARDLKLPPAHQTGATGRALNSLSNKELLKLQKSVRDLWSIASKLREDRFKKGSLNLDMEETKIFVDENGYADRLEKIVNDESHQLIEEFMLLANECVARDMKRNNLPCIYRVHEDPDEERLNELRQYMGTWGIETADLNNRNDLIKLLEVLKDHPQGRLLRTQVLRSLKKACYKSSPDGHYGLCKNDYTHFTSPIRRYSDLVVHRVFETFLVKVGGQKPLEGKAARYNASAAASVAEHLSHTEVNSTEAERESIKVKLLEFFERELEKKQPTVFDAIITEVRNHGMFIELTESNAFGMVHISTLKDDLYRINPSGSALVGRRNKRVYGLGHSIPVMVHRVDRFKRQVDFRISEKDLKPRDKESPLVSARFESRVAPRDAKSASSKAPSRRSVSRKKPAKKAAKKAREAPPKRKPTPTKKARRNRRSQKQGRA